jgi:hypothetical protein
MIDIEELKHRLTYHPKTGLFTWNHSSCRRQEGAVAGCRDVKQHATYEEVYITIGINNRKYRAHRLAFIYMGVLIPKCIDHLNGDSTDNRWGNLRAATHSQNSKNKKKPITNTSGFVGVCRERRSGKWRAYISVNKKQIKFGLYATPEEAYAARVKKLEELGGCDYTRRHGS